MVQVAEKVLTIREAPWNQAAAQMLEKAMRADPLTGVDGLRNLVVSGKAKLFEVLDGCYLRLALVLEVVEQAHGAQGVIVAAGGKMAGVSLTRQVLPSIERLFVGCAEISITTARRGLIRELEKQGYTASQVILRKAL